MPILWGLDDLMTDRKVSGYRLAIQTGLTASAIYKLRHHKTVNRLEGDTLAKLCAALNCQPGDLLVYEPDKPHRTKPAPPAAPAVRKRGGKGKRAAA